MQAQHGFCRLIVCSAQVTLHVQPKDDAPEASDMAITVYSGRSTTFELPAFDPDGTLVEIFILTEPQGSTGVLRLSDEQAVGSNGQRRKVSTGHSLCVHQPGSLRDMTRTSHARQGKNPVTVEFPGLAVPDFARAFR